MSEITTSAGGLAEHAIEEVLALHRVFPRWFSGSIDRTPENFADIAHALGEGFQIVFPSGEKQDRQQLLRELEGAHGGHAASDPPFRIWIENTLARPLTEDICLVTYDELQELNGEITGRTSSALLRRNPDAVRGMEWLHVHETALPAPSRK